MLNNDLLSEIVVIYNNCKQLKFITAFGKPTVITQAKNIS